MHRDLKLENIMLIEEDNKLVVKISDFGWVCQYFNGKKNTLCGTPDCKIY